MKQTSLARAREYELLHGPEILPEERPLFHVTAATGWLNDPNGFSLYKNEYHLFYQYHPYDTHWGPMHWGHVKSSDLIKWERLPAALAPEAEYDKNGVFSGSALETPDGQHLLMYTGVQGTDNTPECRQTQCIAVGNGVEYRKYEKNPVLTTEDIPEPCFAKGFRDPKIWWDEKEQCYFAVAVVRVMDGSGAVALFSSADGFCWSYVNMLDYCRNQYGRMWECPDFFELDGSDKAFLILSAARMRAQGLEFHNGNDVICLTGGYDRKTHTFTRETVSAVDYGLDFYAPQTVAAPDGRRILIGWMQAWETSRFCQEDAKWQGMLTLPREICPGEGRLIQRPVRELLNYRRNPVCYKNVPLQPHTELSGISGRTLDMTLAVRPDNGRSGEISFESFTVHLAQNDEYDVTLTYDPKENTVCLDRTDSGFRYNIITRRKAPVRDQNGSIRLRIIMDRFSIEVFINDGEQVMSACIYTPQEADGISFEAKGTGWFDVEKYDIIL